MASLVTFLLLSLFSRISLSLTTSEKQKILDIHNELRDRVAGGGLSTQGHPAAKDMNELIWDDGLAQVAQDYVDSCPGANHNDDRSFEIVPIRNDAGTKWGKPNGPTSIKSGKKRIRIGENLLVNSRDYNVDSAIAQIESGWFDEYNIWTYGPSSYGCNPNDDYDSCGHYTAMVWANTRYVGCAYKNGCSDWNAIFICNYFPVGNFNGDETAPYEKASSSSSRCSNCMSDRTAPCSSHYESVSETSGGYNGPYNALCGGGASSTRCDGESYSRSTCDGRGSDSDCNDGTKSISSGRDVCSVPAPSPVAVVPTPAPVTPAPTTPTTPTTGGSCSDCITLANIAHDGDYCAQSSKHQGRKVYVKGDKAMYYTGQYWYLWDWGGSVGSLDDDPNGDPDAYCESDLFNCDAKWSCPPKWKAIGDSSVTECGGNAETEEPSSCSDCRYLKIKSRLDGEFCASGTHNGKTLYTADDVAVYWTGTYWYAWDWTGSESDLDDDPNDVGTPKAYCVDSSLSGCSGKWYLFVDGDWSKDRSSNSNICGALESMDCLDGVHSDTVCMDAHNSANTSFIFEQEYMWEFDSCYGGKPMYHYDEYYLFYEERAVDNEETESKEIVPFWIVDGDEEYAYCNKEDLSDCIAGLWNKLVEKDLFAGYVADKQMATKDCPYTEEKVDSPRKSESLPVIVLVVLLLVLLVVVGIALCVYHRHMNKKGKRKVVQDPEDDIALDEKQLTQNDQMEETDATGMLNEIEK